MKKYNYGTEHDDVFHFKDENEVIYGGSGNDKIITRKDIDIDNVKFIKVEKLIVEQTKNTDSIFIENLTPENIKRITDSRIGANIDLLLDVLK